MPIFLYECAYCKTEFEEFHNISDNSGKTYCIKCGNTAYKIPALFNANIFKKRNFADGTTTPEFVNTPSQEKAWLKSQGITYDTPTVKKSDIIKENKIKSKTVMESAFKKAVEKVEQGYKPSEGIKQREVKKINYAA